ncbi:MAG: hypothetical protein JO112_15105 [Planctomycetes bacterium]|nr:hypothetical protein [Planctomycetota bacterium]
MTQATEQPPQETAADTDLVSEVQRVLQASHEPLTVSKIRVHLPARFRQLELEELAETLRRQVTANVFWQFPKYRSQQDRFWDRPMAEHVRALLGQVLENGPLPWTEIRRKLPAYAQTQAEAVLEEQVAQGRLFRHPRAGRGGERFGLQAADPKDYLRTELGNLFRRLEQLGFTQNQLRESALDLLHEEEWSPTSPAPSGSAEGIPAQAQEEAAHLPEATAAAASSPEPLATKEPAPTDPSGEPGVST